jgi:hypothetical protein
VGASTIIGEEGEPIIAFLGKGGGKLVACAGTYPIYVPLVSGRKVVTGGPGVAVTGFYFIGAINACC